ncbi:hypothetical protein Anas_03316 [Armadillidium nasatum]|uniref:Cadherin domain-containing protein n=1 Tax=Armadillidium nasatum TaxID=96803 RepID=A0A5N5TBE3_9CRUS|nr:hypothetical protein Anas_03316 [Armadillidium nasatum]
MERFVNIIVEKKKSLKSIYIVQMDASGTPRLTGTGTISILVEDKNDHAPVFPNSHYRIDVSESVEPGSPILTVAAKDKDAGFNINNIVNTCIR